MITKYIDNWFSNMKPFYKPLYGPDDGIEYKTVENFYQAMKTTIISKRLIIASASPYKARGLGKRVLLRKDWGEIKTGVMKLAIYYKFAPGTPWFNRLMLITEPVVEINNWHDNHWGNCVCNLCEHIEGMNKLGNIIMEAYYLWGDYLSNKFEGKL